MLALMLVAAAVRGASADENSPTVLGGKYGLETDVEIQSRPGGADVTMGPWYRYTYHADESPLWDGLYVQGGGVVSINPAYGQLGIYGEWMPVAILQLYVQADRFSYFGRDGSLLVYTDRNQRFGSRHLKERRGQEVTGNADRLMFRPTLQFQSGHYAVINETTYAFYRFDRSGPYFWDQEYDTLLAKRDRLFADDFSVLYDFTRKGRDNKFLVGPSFEVVRALGADLMRERLGLSFYYEPTPSKSIFGHLQRPRFYFQAGVNTRDRNYDDLFYFVGGIGADFDLD